MIIFVTIKIVGLVTTDCLELVWKFEPCVLPFLSGYLNDQERSSKMQLHTWVCALDSGIFFAPFLY